MQDRPPVIVSGALAYDDVFLYPGRIKEHLPTDRSAPLYLNLRAHGPQRSLGGCGGNVAYSLSLLNTPVSLHGWLGRDGERYLAGMSHLSVDVSGVTVADDVLTSRAVLLADAAGDQILFFGEPERSVDIRVPDLNGYSMAVVTAGSPHHTLEFLRSCRDCGVPSIVDPGKLIMDLPPQALREAITGVDSIVFNEYEHDLFLERLGMTAGELERRVSSVVVTKGGGGMLVTSRGTAERIAPVRLARVVDPNGAGDAFLAGYTFGRYNGFPSTWSARIGAVAASFVLEAHGAQNHRWNRDGFIDRLSFTYGKPERDLPL